MAKNKSEMTPAEAEKRKGDWARRKRQKEDFKKGAMDRRRYRVFTIDELNKIRAIIDETIEGKKSEFIEELKKQKMELEKKIRELEG